MTLKKVLFYTKIDVRVGMADNASKSWDDKLTIKPFYNNEKILNVSKIFLDFIIIVTVSVICRRTRKVYFFD